MKLDIYKRCSDKKKNAFISVDVFTKEYLFSIKSNTVPQIGEKMLLDESGQEYEVVKVQRVICGKPENKIYEEEYFIVEVDEGYLVSLENPEIKEAVYRNIIK